MKRILILGGTGMLGHKALQVFSRDLDVFTTVRGEFASVSPYGWFRSERTIPRVDVLDARALATLMDSVRPGVVLNCIGIIKQKKEASQAVPSIELNSLLPHRLASLCSDRGIRLIHISTDCVFSGLRGCYTEQDNPDPVDLYGRTKLLGEVTQGDSLTLRSSIIGHELGTKNGLLEWFLSQNGASVKGFAGAIYSGFPTVIFCDLLKTIIADYSEVKGLYHLSSDPIDKYSLLCLIESAYGMKVRIEKSATPVCDRSLDSSALRQILGWRPESWERMVRAMKDDADCYIGRQS